MSGYEKLGIGQAIHALGIRVTDMQRELALLRQDVRRALSALENQRARPRVSSNLVNAESDVQVAAAEASAVLFRDDQLIEAVLDDDVAGVRKLLRVSAIRSKMMHVLSRLHVERQGRSRLLHLAAYSNSVNVAQVLIDNGEGVNSENDEGDTPLHVAARYNAWEMADLLIGCGARIHVLNNAAQSPQDVAVACGNSSLAELLRLAAIQPID